MQLQAGQAVVVAHGAAQAEVAQAGGVRKRFEREAGRQVGHGHELVLNGVAVTAGGVLQSQRIGLRTQDLQLRHEARAAGRGPQGTGRVLQQQRQRIGGGGREFPAGAGAFGHGQVAAVGDGFGGFASVGRVRQPHLKLSQIRPFQHREVVFGRSKARARQLKIHVRLRLLEHVAELVGPACYLAQAALRTGQQQAHLGGQGLPGQGHVEGKIFAPKRP